MRTAPRTIACLCSLLIVSCGAERQPELDGDLVLARFGDDVVTARDVIALILERNQLDNLLRLSVLEKVAQAIEKAVPEIACGKMVAGIARAERVDATDSFRAWRTELVNRKLEQLVLEVDTVLKVKVTNEDVERYYRENPSEFTQPETYTFRGIACLDKNWGGREGTRGRIREVLAHLEAGEDFVEVAQAYSDSPRHLRGKPQGPFNRGEGMRVEIEEALISMATGEYSGIIEGKKGAAIYQLIDRTEAKKKELGPALRWLIQSTVSEDRREREEKILVERLVKRDAITYRPDLLNDPMIPDASVALEVRGSPPVRVGDLREKLGPLDQSTTTQRRDLFDARAASLLLLAEARRRGYAEKDVAPRLEYWERRELADRYVRSLLDEEELSVDELRQYFLSHRDELVTEASYRLYRIFIAAEIREDMKRFERLSAFGRAHNIAQTVYNRIAGEGMPFQDAAREYSSDRVTAAEGGYVGQVHLSQLDSDFYTLFEIASTLEAGLVTQPQAASARKNHLGYDLYYCAEVEPSRALTFEEALPRIGRELAESRREDREATLREELLQANPLVIDTTAVEHLAQVLSEIRKSSPSGADFIKVLLPRSRLKALGL